MAIIQRSWKYILSSLLFGGSVVLVAGCGSKQKQTTNGSDSHIHLFSSWNSSVASTCIEKGHVGFYQCTECLKYFDENYHELESIELDYADHNYTHVNKVEPTCGAKGMEEHFICDVCNKYFDLDKHECSRESLEIDKSDNHNYQIISKTKSTTVSEGSITYQCLDCGHIETKQILKMPFISLDSTGTTINWNAISNAEKYIVYKDGKAIDNGKFTSYGIEAGATSGTYCVSAYTSSAEYEGIAKSNTITISYDYDLISNFVSSYTLSNKWNKSFGNFASTGTINIVSEESLCAQLKPDSETQKKATITKSCSFDVLKEAGNYILTLKVKKTYTADGTLRFGIYDGSSWVITNKIIDISNINSNEWCEISVPYSINAPLTKYFNLDIIYTCDYYCLDNYVLLDDIVVKSADGSKIDAKPGDFEVFSTDLFKKSYALSTSSNVGEEGKYRISVLVSSTKDTREISLSYSGTNIPTSTTFTNNKINKNPKWYDFWYTISSDLESVATLNITTTNVNLYDVKLNKVTTRSGDLSNCNTYSPDIDSIEYVSMLTGVNAQLDSTLFDVDGTDLGISYYDSTRHQMRYLFGDTFSNVTPEGELTSNWRSQTMGITSDLDASDGIKFDTWLSNGTRAKALVSSKHNKDVGEITRIPTGGIAINGTHYVFFMSIREWETASGWDVNYCSLLKSTDGNNFSLINNVYFCNSDSKSINYAKSDLNLSDVSSNINSNFMQVYPYLYNNYVYLFGLPQGRKGAVKVARVTVSSFEDMKEYEYFTNSGWVKGADGLALCTKSNATSEIGVSELSVSHNPYLGKFILTYFNGLTNNLSYQTSDDLIHWSNEQIILKSSDFITLYGAFTNDLLMENNGKTMYFVMSQYASKAVYNVLGEDQYNSKVMKIIFN